jgi:lipid-A-disaccharide synthase-like uncharacterized protein
MHRLLLIFCLFCLTPALRASESLDELGRPVDPAEIEGPAARFKVDLSGAKNNVKVVHLKDGSIGYIVKRLGAGEDRLLTPEEFAKLFYEQQTEERSWLGNAIFFTFNTTSPIGIAWVSIGLGGQAIFMGRMLVQWFVSEKSKRSVIPVSFWWMSLIGSTMLLIYFFWRRDIVGILGNATGWVVYIRNLILIHRAAKERKTAAA